MKKALITLLLILPFVMGVSNYTLTSYPNMESALSINDNGDVVGKETGGNYLVAWIDGRRYIVGNGNQTQDINNIGQVVGINIGIDGIGTGFVWSYNEASSQALSPVANDVQSSVYDINNNGLVIGISSHDLSRTPVLWDTNTIDLFKMILPVTVGAINDNDIIVGTPLRGSEYSVAYFHPEWDEPEVVVGVRMTVQHRGLNNVDQFIGIDPDTGESILYDGEKIVVLNNGVHDKFVAYGINDNTQIVGSINNSSDFRAAIWEDGVIYDLNDYVPELNTNVLSSARAINNYGQILCIAGDYVAGHDSNALILTPIAESIPVEEPDPIPVEEPDPIPVELPNTDPEAIPKVTILRTDYGNTSDVIEGGSALFEVVLDKPWFETINGEKVIKSIGVAIDFISGTATAGGKPTDQRYPNPSDPGGDFDSLTKPVFVFDGPGTQYLFVNTHLDKVVEPTEYYTVYIKEVYSMFTFRDLSDEVDISSTAIGNIYNATPSILEPEPVPDPEPVVNTSVPFNSGGGGGGCFISSSMFEGHWVVYWNGEKVRVIKTNEQGRHLIEVIRTKAKIWIKREELEFKREK